MTRRSRAREVALQLLFWRDANPATPRPTIERFIRERLHDTDLELFSQGLFDGVTTNAVAIDAKLADAAENWRLARMAAVDRNVLRLGTFELLYAAETPPAVALNEAIELARRYGSKDSPAFVNGVLDRINQLRTADSESRIEERPPIVAEGATESVVSDNPQPAIKDSPS